FHHPALQPLRGGGDFGAERVLRVGGEGGKRQQQGAGQRQQSWHGGCSPCRVHQRESCRKSSVACSIARRPVSSADSSGAYSGEWFIGACSSGVPRGVVPTKK